MRKKIGSILATLVLGLTAWGPATAAPQSCNVRFTPEQERVLGTAYEVGHPANFGVTLQAIAWKESFVGNKVVRANPTDGRYGSYGVSHVQVSTGAWLLDKKPSPAFRKELKNDLMTDDEYALQYALTYLHHTQAIAKRAVKGGNRQWRATVAAYNGRGEQAKRYVEDVATKVKYLKACGLTMTSKRVTKASVAKDSPSKASSRQALATKLAKLRGKPTPPTKTAAREKEDIADVQPRRTLTPARLVVKSSMGVAPALTQKAIQARVLDIYKRAGKKAKDNHGVIGWAKTLAAKHQSTPLDQQFLFPVQTLTAACVAAGLNFHDDLNFMNLLLTTGIKPGVSIVMRRGKVERVLASKQEAVKLMEDDPELTVVHSVVV